MLKLHNEKDKQMDIFEAGLPKELFECFLQVLFPRFCKLLFAATPQGILRVALH